MLMTNPSRINEDEIRELRRRVLAGSGYGLWHLTLLVRKKHSLSFSKLLSYFFWLPWPPSDFCPLLLYEFFLDYFHLNMTFVLLVSGFFPLSEC